MMLKKVALKITLLQVEVSLLAIPLPPLGKNNFLVFCKRAKDNSMKICNNIITLVLH